MIKSIFSTHPSIIMNSILLILLFSPFKSKNFNPLIFMIILILSTFMISMNMNLINNTILHFMMFLIMIGGLMIIFMYVTSLTNNELFSFKKINFKQITLKLFLLTFILIFLLTMNNYIPHNFFTPLADLPVYKMSLSNLYTNHKSLLGFLVNYLLYAMICIINICYILNKPLRQINHYE